MGTSKPMWDDPNGIRETLRALVRGIDLGSVDNPFRDIHFYGSLTGPGAEGNNFSFGDGSLGDVSWPQSNPAALAQLYYNNLTIPVAQTLDLSAGGIIVRVKDTLTIGGTILSAGANGANAAGATGGTSAANAGANGGTGVGAQPTDEAAVNPNNGGNGGAGGAGGAGTPNAGGASRATVTSVQTDIRYLAPNPDALAANLVAQDGQAGSAGGGDGTNSGGGGGGAGAGAPAIFIFAKTIVMAATGIIRGRGGSGGNGGASVAGNTGGGGGAGGGGGSFIYLVYNELTLATGAVIQSVGGALGTGGAKQGTGVVGSPGVAGGAGVVLKFNLSTGTLDA